jgi:hypothetical protein
VNGLTKSQAWNGKSKRKDEAQSGNGEDKAEFYGCDPQYSFEHRRTWRPKLRQKSHRTPGDFLIQFDMTRFDYENGVWGKNGNSTHSLGGLHAPENTSAGSSPLKRQIQNWHQPHELTMKWHQDDPPNPESAEGGEGQRCFLSGPKKAGDRARAPHPGTSPVKTAPSGNDANVKSWT